MIEIRGAVLWLVGIALVVVALAAGCGTSQEPVVPTIPTEPTETAAPTTEPTEPTPTAGPTATSTAAQTSAPTVAPTLSPTSATIPAGKYGGHIVALAKADVEHFDVHRDVSAALAARGPGVAYSRMLRLRTGAEVAQPSLLLECDLCESWRLDGPLVYEFRLKDNVRWQDLSTVNGRKLSAQDVVFSYDRQRTSGWPNSPLLLALDTVEATDELTVRVGLKFWDTDFLLALADGRSKVVAPEVVIGSGSLEPGPVVGTGPWVWLRTLEGDGTEFEANPDYFEEGLPFADLLTFKVIKDPETRVAAFITGQLDIFDAEAGEWELFQSRGFPSRTVVSREGGLGLMLAMNAGQPPFDDRDVRRAVFQSLEPWAYLEGGLTDEEMVGAGVPVVEESWLLDREATQIFFDGEPGIDVQGKVVELVVGDFGNEQLELGRRVNLALQEAGFTSTLTVLNPVEYAERVWRNRDYQMFLGPPPPASGPNGFLFPALHSVGQWNILQHEDSELDRLIELQQGLGFNSAERGEVLREIQRRLLGEAYVVSLGGGDTLWVMQDAVSGFHPNTASAEYFFWAKTWLGGEASLGG